MKLVLVDGYNMVFRAYYGMPELTRRDGFPTGAIHGWVKSLGWIDDHLKPDRLVVFFDLGGASRQTAMREDYKANRSETPPELEQQVPLIKELTRSMGYFGFEKDGIEADDLIAAYAEHFGKAGHEVIIVSADKDLGQLVKGTVSQLLPPPTANPQLGWRRLEEDGVLEKFGVKPDQIPDYLALIGDTSDNIPGLRGVGPKTAVKWLSQYKTLDGVIDHCGELMPRRFQGLVHAEADNLRLNLQMTTLDPDHAIESIDEVNVDAKRAIELLDELEMTQTAQWVRKKFGV